jgi:methyl-accepting chemotaxis protein
MKSKWTAYAMIFSALLGWLISLAGLIGLWLILPQINQSSLRFIGLSKQLLDLSSQLLDTSDTTLGLSVDSLGQIQAGLNDVASTFGKTSPAFKSAAKLTGTDFVKMTTDTRNALISLKSTAKVIDDTMRLISKIPLVGPPYNPPAPLDVSIDNLAMSMEKLPAHLVSIQSWLDGTGNDLAILQEDTTQLANIIGTIQPQLQAAQKFSAECRQLVAELKKEMDYFSAITPQILLVIGLILSIFLVWIGISQIGPFTLGLERLHIHSEKN